MFSPTPTLNEVTKTALEALHSCSKRSEESWRSRLSRLQPT